MYTTLKIIKSYMPCICSYKTLLKHLNKTEADDEPVHILTILEATCIADAMWALRCFPRKDSENFLIELALKYHFDLAEYYFLYSDGAGSVIFNYINDKEREARGKYWALLKKELKALFVKHFGEINVYNTK